MEKVLITGIAGGQGRLLARRLLENWEVCGADWVPWEGPRGASPSTTSTSARRSSRT